jgi:hypothetical protein
MYPGLGAVTPSGRTVARHLIDDGKVLPILDGLDEMVAGLRREALHALNRLGECRMVLTSRSGEYREAVGVPAHDCEDELQGVQSVPAVLTGAAVVEIQPLLPERIIEYLRAAIHPRQAAEWAQVFEQIRSFPDGALTKALSTPLMSFLARTAYGDTATDPTGLLDPEFRTAEDIEDRLLEKFIPAVYTDHPTPDGRRPRWKTEDIRTWLGCLATQMRAAGTDDLVWWNLHRTVPRVGLAGGMTTGLISGLVGGLGLGIFAALVASFMNAPLRSLWIRHSGQVGPQVGVWLLSVTVVGLLVWRFTLGVQRRPQISRARVPKPASGVPAPTAAEAG